MLANKCDPQCCLCNVFDDDFAVDNLSSDWDQRSGTWSVAGGELTTTSADALIVTTSADIVFQVLKLNFQHSATGAQVIRGIVAYQDDDNYIFAQVKYDTPADP